MWRWTMLVMCLIAALSGTPLRQAEAASDLARALADLDASGDVEVPDGGVGDDSVRDDQVGKHQRIKRDGALYRGFAGTLEPRGAAFNAPIQSA